MAVHFQSVEDKFTPRDAVFAFVAPDELKDSSLSSEIALHTAASIRSVSESHLSGITEDEGDARSEVTQKPDKVEEEKVVVVGDSKSSSTPPPPSSRDDAQTRHEKVTEILSAMRKHGHGHGDRREHSRSPPPSLHSRNPSDTNKALPLLPEKTKALNAPKPQSIYEFDSRPSFSGPSGRLSSQSARPSTSELNMAYEYKPKVKLGPRPSIDSVKRPSTAGTNGIYRPVSTLPAGLRMPVRKQVPGRPQSEQKNAPFTSSPSPRIPLPPPPPNSSYPNHSKSMMPANGVTIPTKPPQPKQPSLTPEKKRLMKALELRNKQIAAKSEATNIKAKEEAQKEVDQLLMGKEQSAVASRDPEPQPSVPATPDIEPEPEPDKYIDGESVTPREFESQDSPVSALEPSEGQSTQASSISEGEATSQKPSHASEETIKEDEPQSDEVRTSDEPRLVSTLESEPLQRVTIHPRGGDAPKAGTTHAKRETVILDSLEPVRQPSAEDIRPQRESDGLLRAPDLGRPVSNAEEDDSHEVVRVYFDHLQKGNEVAPNHDARLPTDGAIVDSLDVAKPNIDVVVPNKTEVFSPKPPSIRDSSSSEDMLPIQGHLDEDIPPKRDFAKTPGQEASVKVQSTDDLQQLLAESIGLGLGLETKLSSKSSSRHSPSRDSPSALEASFLPPEAIKAGEKAPSPIHPLTPKPSPHLLEQIKVSRPSVTSSPKQQPLSLSTMDADSRSPDPALLTASTDTSQMDKKLKMRGIANSLKRTSSPDQSEEQFLSDDSFMEELKTAAVQEAKPISVSKSPIRPVFSRNGTESKTSDKPKTLRTVSSPLTDRAAEDSPPALPTPSSMRSFSATPWANVQPIQVNSSKKNGVSSSISQRIKALEQLSNRPTSPTLQSTPQATFISINDRKNSLRSPPASPELGKSSSQPTSNLPSPSIPSPPANTARVLNGVPKPRPESISVTATIIRDPNDRSPEKPVDFGTRPDPLHQSPLVVEHQSMIASPPPFSPLQPPRPQYVRTSSSRSGDTGKQLSPKMSRRESFASWRSGSSRNGSDLDLPRSTSEKSLNSTAGLDGSKEEKKDSRGKRFLKRMSNITTGSKRGFGSALSPGPKEASIMEHQEPVEPAPSSSVDLGDMNIQFPDTLLWKSRHMIIDESGTLVLSPASTERNPRIITKRFPLAEFRAPYIPDQDRQELPHSRFNPKQITLRCSRRLTCVLLGIILDFKNGSTLQCACETARGQAKVFSSKSTHVNTNSAIPTDLYQLSGSHMLDTFRDTQGAEYAASYTHSDGRLGLITWTAWRFGGQIIQLKEICCHFPKVFRLSKVTLTT